MCSNHTVAYSHKTSEAEELTLSREIFLRKGLNVFKRKKIIKIEGGQTNSPHQVWQFRASVTVLLQLFLKIHC